jgi:glutamine---fructose-6-phosphate transaminase (isomerizing)
MMNLQIPDSMKPSFERKEHPYFYYESLMSTPQGLQLVLAEDSLAMIKKVADALADKEIVHIVGNGTSYFNAAFIAHALNLIGGKLAVVHPAYDFYAYPPCDLGEKAALIGISHSGTSPAVVDAMDLAKSKGMLTISICDFADSALTKMADLSIFSENVEINGPKSRSYVASLLRGLLLAIEVGNANGKDNSALRSALDNAPALVEKVLADNEAVVKKFAESRVSEPNARIVFTGAGYAYSTAMEAALKVVETMLLHACPWELEEAVHGTWVSQKEGELLVVFAPRGDSYNKCKVLVKGMKTVGAYVWVITDEPEGMEGADFTTILPAEITEQTYALYGILPVYQFIYYHTLAQGGLHPDRAPYEDPKFMKARFELRTWR